MSPAMPAADRSDAMLRKAVGGQYGPLLCALLILCVTSPGLTGGTLKGGLLDILMSCIVVTGLYASLPKRRSIALGLALTAITLSTHRLVTAYRIEWLHGFHYALILAVLAFATLSILSAVVHDAIVTIETIKGAVCVYLLIGLAWVYVFALIDMGFPGSFKIDPTSETLAVGHLLVRRQLPRLLYFSYATLTTLGYGDIVPLRGPAQTACYLEAIVGQMYLTVLVARLVGMHITHAPGAVMRVEGGGHGDRGGTP